MNKYLSLVLVVYSNPFSLAYTDGARNESCYGHEIVHYGFDRLPKSKTVCMMNCQVLSLEAKVNETTLEEIERNVSTYECGSTYRCKFQFIVQKSVTTQIIK